MVRGPLGWWLLVAVLAAGCATSNANEGTPDDRTDVWFMQHMAGHLLQTTAVVTQVVTSLASRVLDHRTAVDLQRERA
jgi:hypothetical protein